MTRNDRCTCPTASAVCDGPQPDCPVHGYADATMTLGEYVKGGGGMRRVIIESPYAGDVEANVDYAREAMADSLHRGEAPFASHLLYTQPGVLDDAVPAERELGMNAGFAWHDMADLVVAYVDLGMSPGMLAGIRNAKNAGIEVDMRWIR